MKDIQLINDTVLTDQDRLSQFIKKSIFGILRKLGFHYFRSLFASLRKLKGIAKGIGIASLAGLLISKLA